jgi:hypothetical protein
MTWLLDMLSFLDFSARILIGKFALDFICLTLRVKDRLVVQESDQFYLIHFSFQCFKHIMSLVVWVLSVNSHYPFSGTPLFSIASLYSAAPSLIAQCYIFGY